MDADIDRGFDAPDEHCLEEEILASVDVDLLLKDLTPEQRELMRRIYISGESQKDIADELGLDKTSIRDRLKTIFKKINKNFENYPH